MPAAGAVAEPGGCTTGTAGAGQQGLVLLKVAEAFRARRRELLPPNSLATLGSLAPRRMHLALLASGGAVCPTRAEVLQHGQEQ